MRVPAELPQWMKKAGIKWISLKNGVFYKGHNRYWRVNASGNFECSVPLEHFDRWANSTGARWEGVPQTEAEFLEAVAALVTSSATG